jgi:hypothetical protein
MPNQVVTTNLVLHPNQVVQPAAGAFQDNVKELVVLDSRLPQMPQAPVSATTVQGVKMPDAPAARPIAGLPTMTAFQSNQSPPAPTEAKYADMKAHPETARSASPGESYVLLRVRATGDRLTVIGANEVQGPLIISSTVAGEHAYEVTLDSKPLVAEGILDVGVSRSFPRPGSNEHYITTRSSFDFNVRVPRSAVPDQALQRLSITLYRFPDASPKLIQGGIAAQTGLQAKPVATLPALKLETLAPEVNKQLLHIFPAIPQAPK